MIDVLLVGIGGSLGALTRYGIGRFSSHESFPWGTMLVNAIGCFILGVVLGFDSPFAWVLFIGVGFCGALTTYSAFSYHTVRLWWDGRPAAASAHAFGTLIVGLVLFVTGWVAGLWVPM